MSESRDLRFWDDSKLVKECQKGVETAWGELIRRFGPMIYGITRRFRLAPEDCVDVYGQVCRSLLEHLSQLRSAERLAGFVATTTQRACIAVIRANARRSRIADAVYKEMNDPAGTESDPEEFASRILRGHQIRRALDMQDERCRKLLWHLFFDPAQPEYAEISEELKIPVASIGPTRSRCLEKFRRTLERLGFDK